MVLTSTLLPGHPAADKSKAFRQGYAEGMKEEFESFKAPPQWGEGKR
jgi:hypothetical protein